MLSNMRKALDGLSNKELISHKPRSGRISESAKPYGSNKKEIEEAIKKFFNFDEKVSINDEQVIEQLDRDTLRELISMFDKYEYGGVSVQVNNRIYVIEFNLEEDDCYLKVEDYADLFNEKGIDPFIYAEPIGTLKKNKKFQQAWRNFKLGGEPKFINESTGEEINELSQPMRIFHTETLEDYDALMKELESKGIEPLVGHRWKEHGKNTVVYVHSKKGRFYMRYGSIVDAVSDYPDIPIEKYKATLEKTNGEEINESSSINENTSNANLTKLRKVIKSVYDVTEEFEISETTLKLLNKRAMKEILEHLSEYYEDRVIVESDKNLYVVDYAIYEDGIYFECTEYQDAWAEGGVDPFETFTPIGRLAKNKALQLAWQAAGMGEEPDLEGIKESISRRREINESPSINANITKPNLKKLKKVLNDVYGVTEGIDISGTTLELLNKRAMKELIDHISENDEDRVIIESDEHLYVIDYAVYEDGVYLICTDYQTAWEESRVDPFELANPIGILATNKALQKAWQAAGMGEEPDLDDVYESTIKESARQSDNLYAVEMAGVIRTDIFVQAEDAHEAESKVNKKEFRGHFLAPKNIRVNDVKESYPTDSASSFAVATGNDDLEGRERDSIQGDNWYQLSVAATISTDIYVEADDMYEAEEKARRTNFTGVFEVPNNLRIDAVFDSWPVDEVPSGTIKIS